MCKPLVPGVVPARFWRQRERLRHRPPAIVVNTNADPSLMLQRAVGGGGGHGGCARVDLRYQNPQSWGGGGRNSPVRLNVTGHRPAKENTGLACKYQMPTGPAGTPRPQLLEPCWDE